MNWILADSGVGTIAAIVVVVLVIVTLFKTARIVPQKQAWIVERLGKYHETLNAGLHILLPFVDRVSYKVGLKEVALDVPPQQCVTKDNITVEIDGLLYLQVVDPVRASYGISNYVFACSQLAQTTLRSEVGKLGYAVVSGGVLKGDSEMRKSAAIAFANRCIANHVAGVVMEPIELVPGKDETTAEILALLKEMDIPVVLVDRDVSSSNGRRSEYDLVGIDNFAAGYRLGRHTSNVGRYRELVQM